MFILNAFALRESRAGVHDLFSLILNHHCKKAEGNSGGWSAMSLVEANPATDDATDQVVAEVAPELEVFIPILGWIKRYFEASMCITLLYFQDETPTLWEFFYDSFDADEIFCYDTPKAQEL